MRYLVVAVLLALLAAGCGGTEPSTTSAEAAPVGWGLDDVAVPGTQDEVNVVFLAMPAELDGMTAERDDPDHVGFVHYVGDTADMGVAWQQLGDYDRATALQQLKAIDMADEFTTAAKHLDSESGIVFLQGTVEETGEQLLYWGDPSDGQMFVFSADTEAHLDILVEAFAEAADG